MSQLTSREALALTANFAFAADRMRAADSSYNRRAELFETASRIAFLRAELLARTEEIQPVLGQLFHRASFAIA